MAQKELYKTKMCNLFMRGHCPRASCTFAHGDEELRRSSFSNERYSGHRGRDLRDRIDRFSSRRSPPRDFRRNDSRRTPPRPRGRSRSLSPIKRKNRSASPDRGWRPSSDPNERHSSKDVKRVRRDDSVARSEGLSEGEKDREAPARVSPTRAPSKRSAGSTVETEELELEKRSLQGDLEDLTDRKKLLEDKVERRSKETKNLSLRMTELEALLLETEEDNQMLLTKLKKLIKAQQRVARAQDELKKFQGKLYKLVEEMPLEDAGELHTSLLHHAPGSSREPPRSGRQGGSEPVENLDPARVEAPVQLPPLEEADDEAEDEKPARKEMMDLNKGPPEAEGKGLLFRSERAPPRAYRRRGDHVADTDEEREDPLDRAWKKASEGEMDEEEAAAGGRVSGDRAALLRELGLEEEEEAEKDRRKSKAENRRLDNEEGEASPAPASTQPSDVKVEAGMDMDAGDEGAEAKDESRHGEAKTKAGAEEEDVDVEGMMDEAAAKSV